MPHSAVLVLADGTAFHGCSIGAPGSAVGEVVFNTALTGYQEILTDPSYASQLVALTYPHIGNVGVNQEDAESRRIFCAGLIVRTQPQRPSNWRCEQTLSAYLQANGIVAISDIDTRQLTRLIRTNGAQSGCIMAGPGLSVADALARAKDFPGLSGMDLAAQVTVAAPYDWNSRALPGGWMPSGYQPAGPTGHRVTAYDFGIKHHILRLLVERGCQVTVVPATTPAEAVLADAPDGVFLSNGPGDPQPCGYAIEAIRSIVARGVPVFGICLGHQLLALASGGQTEKMKFGHHGANHPVQDLHTRRVFITSQNHGFTVTESGLPACLRVTHRSLFDQTVQGVERLDQPAFSFQGHPEASPGPRDIRHLFDRFVAMMAARPDRR